MWRTGELSGQEPAALDYSSRRRPGGHRLRADQVDQPTPRDSDVGFGQLFAAAIAPAFESIVA
jgi:hypothetical protein